MIFIAVMKSSEMKPEWGQIGRGRLPECLPCLTPAGSTCQPLYPPTTPHHPLGLRLTTATDIIICTECWHRIKTPEISTFMLENNCQENTCNCPNWDNSRFSQIVKLSLFCSILSQGGWVFGPTEASFSVPWSIVPWYYVHLKSESRWCKWSWLNPVAGIICVCRQLEIWKSGCYYSYAIY